MKRTYKMIASRGNEIVFDDRIQSDTPRNARSELKNLLGLKSLSGIVYSITEIYGDWREWQGMRASNLYFLPLRDDSPSSTSQRLLKLSVTCGNPDTRSRRK